MPLIKEVGSWRKFGRSLHFTFIFGKVPRCELTFRLTVSAGNLIFSKDPLGMTERGFNGETRLSRGSRGRGDLNNKTKWETLLM